MPSLHLDKFYPVSQSQFKYPLLREILPKVQTRGAILSFDPNAPSSSSLSLSFYLNYYPHHTQSAPTRIQTEQEQVR